MRSWWIVLIIGCGTRSHSRVDDAAPGEAQPVTCPSSVADGDAFCPTNQNVVCSFASDGGRPNVCVCGPGGFSCSDCPDEPPTGSCTAPDGCEYSTFTNEFDCSCYCTTAGTWACQPGEPNAPCS